ncbi:MAG: TetR/AcrR family transcriptional regulator [Candidatus Eremiobacteraeota bacterium]|nr:TetR/AcrR family transcriptional regulator [Candidatus Eremiobacteraeota bacterium]
MPRRPDRENRLDLLDRAVDYVSENGIADLSLRPLAHALGVSPAILLYHFASKENMIVELLGRAGDRQRTMFERLRSDDSASAQDVCREAWRVLSAPRALPLFRLFFEVYALALQSPARFPAFFPGAVHNWLGFLERPALREGCSPSEARRRATVILAGYRGFLLDLCATHERKRVEGAVEAWIRTLPFLGEDTCIGAS